MSESLLEELQSYYRICEACEDRFSFECSCCYVKGIINSIESDLDESIWNE